LAHRITKEFPDMTTYVDDRPGPARTNFRSEDRPANVSRSKAFQASPRVAYLFLTATMAMWAVCIVVARGVHETVPPLGLTFWRWFTASLILLPFVWCDLERSWTIVRGRMKMFVGLSAVLALSSAGMIASVQYTTAINTTLINATQPAITAIGAMLLGREHFGPWQWLGVVAAAFGIGIMATRADLVVLSTFAFNAGDIIIFIATFGYAAYALNLKRLPNEVGLFTSLFVLASMGSLILLPLYVGETLAVRPMPVSWEAAGAVVTLAVFMSVISIFTWNAGNRAVGPSKAGIFVNLFPVFGAAFAILFLGERLFAFHLWGALFVCVGITLVVLAGRRGTSRKA
jgi:drug/metabolite transporter (DMT)-like permease